jgi:four helix bundle protein
MARNFEDLEIWKKAHQLTLVIYKITGTWPKAEIYGLTSQIRRAAISVELIIAEGHARHHYKDMIRFMIEARASAEEVRNCLMLAHDLEEIKFDKEQFEYFNNEYIGLIKGINGFISYLRRNNLVS